MDTLDRILKLVENKQMTQADFARAIGARSSSVSDWTKRKSTSYTKYLDKIAKYFDVSVDYLVTGEENQKAKKPALTPKDERDIGKKVDEILSQLVDSSDALMFDGEPLDDETAELLRASLENSYKMAKMVAKQKYTPKKYR